MNDSPFPYEECDMDLVSKINEIDDTVAEVAAAEERLCDLLRAHGLDTSAVIAALATAVSQLADVRERLSDDRATSGSAHRGDWDSEEAFCAQADAKGGWL